jgi:hypothetical protein
VISRAGEWCERLAEFCERYGSKPLFSVCRTHYAGVLVSRGKWPEAEEELRLAAPELEQNAAGMAAETLVGMAELRRRQGRLEEARQMFERVEHRPDGRLGCAMVALDLGDHRAAADHAERYLREVGGEAKSLRVGGLEILARALAGLHRFGVRKRSAERTPTARVGASESGRDGVSFPNAQRTVRGVLPERSRPLFWAAGAAVQRA